VIPVQPVRDHPDALARQMERLHLSARRLIWINPLLRWEDFAPKARGIAAMLPHVDAFRAGHSIASLEDLARVISKRDDVGDRDRLLALL
ncbi:MAG: VWA domain-containing protein, partial [Pseudomonadota bacterium]